MRSSQVVGRREGEPERAYGVDRRLVGALAQRALGVVEDRDGHRREVELRGGVGNERAVEGERVLGHVRAHHVERGSVLAGEDVREQRLAGRARVREPQRRRLVHEDRQPAQAVVARRPPRGRHGERCRLPPQVRLGERDDAGGGRRDVAGRARRNLQRHLGQRRAIPAVDVHRVLLDGAGVAEDVRVRGVEHELGDAVAVEVGDLTGVGARADVREHGREGATGGVEADHIEGAGVCARACAGHDPGAAGRDGYQLGVPGALGRGVDLEPADLRRPGAIGVEPVDGDDVEEVDGIAVAVEVEGLGAVGDDGPIAALRVAEFEVERARLERVVAELARRSRRAPSRRARRRPRRVRQRWASLRVSGSAGLWARAKRWVWASSR